MNHPLISIFLNKNLLDHNLSDGSLSFDILGHPVAISVGRVNDKPFDLEFTTGSYPGALHKASELMKTSFVNYSFVSIADYVNQQRIAKMSCAAITEEQYPNEIDPMLVKGWINYQTTSEAAAPDYRSLKKDH